MMTECKRQQLEFSSVGRRKVTASFDGGHLTSDGGGVLLGEVDKRIGLLHRLGRCFTDHRNQAAIEHTVEDMVSQRIYALALGYEDLNDHNRLRSDPAMALLVGKADLTGQDRRRRRDKGNPLASASGLNRLELSRADTAPSDRYKKIAANFAGMDALLTDLFLEAHPSPPERIILDLDATDDPLHGNQEGRFFHGYYRSYCYLPLYVFCGEHLLLARLRPAARDPGAGVVEELSPIIARIRSAWPGTRIILRADSGFARDETMSWVRGRGHLLRLRSGAQPETAAAAGKGAAKVTAALYRHRFPVAPLSPAALSDPYLLVEAPPRGRQGRASAQGIQPPLPSHQPALIPYRQEGPLREALLPQRGHGKPHQGDAVGTVRRPHQHRHHGGQPAGGCTFQHSPTCF